MSRIPLKHKWSLFLISSSGLYKKKKKKLFSKLGKSDMVLVKKEAFFDWERTKIRPLEMGRKSHVNLLWRAFK